MQEASKRPYVDVMIETAILITVSLLKLDMEQLTHVLEAYISGDVAQGYVDYLVKVQDSHVRQMGFFTLPLWNCSCML